MNIFKFSNTIQKQTCDFTGKIHLQKTNNKKLYP